MTVILSTDVFLIHSILSDAEVSFDHISLLGDKRILVAFDNSNKLLAFLSIKEALQEIFSDIKPWTDQVVASLWLVWFNVLGVPVKLWNLEFMKAIGEPCSEFITVSKSTLNRRRLDVALF